MNALEGEEEIREIFININKLFTSVFALLLSPVYFFFPFYTDVVGTFLFIR